MPAGGGMGVQNAQEDSGEGECASSQPDAVISGPSRGNAAVLVADKIRMTFGGVVALDDVSVTVGADELLAVIGPNGAGKTSLMNCMSGFYRPLRAPGWRERFKARTYSPA